MYSIYVRVYNIFFLQEEIKNLSEYPRPRIID